MTNPPPSWQQTIATIATLGSERELATLEQELFGRSHGTMTLALKALGSLSPEERKVQGKELNDWKMKIARALEARRESLRGSQLASIKETEAMDPTLTLPRVPRGHLHPIPSFIAEAEEVFAHMGFDVAEGPEVETEDNNFDHLNFPRDHSARDSMDTFFVESAASLEERRKTEGDRGRWLLRCHTSPVQIRYMRSHTPPFRMVCPGRVYRKDSDATHSPMFHQIEGLMIGPDVSLANMKAIMSTAIRELVGKDVTFRFRSSFFPFTEPGLEVDMRFAAKDGKESPWLEVAGCGMTHPNVLKNCGIDPTKFQGFAFGFGIERLVMIREGIRDLRLFTEGDLKFLEQF